MSSSNSCSCKCGSIICRNIHLHQFNSEKFKTPEFDGFVFSKLHHRSLRVKNSKTIIVDKCCENCLFFHCSQCEEQFSITISKGTKSRFIIGFAPENLTNIDPINHHILVSIPDFPTVLKSYVSLIEEPRIKNNNQIKGKLLSSIDYDVLFTSSSSSDQSQDELTSFDDFEEDIMFGSSKNQVIIGKYQDWSL